MVVGKSEKKSLVDNEMFHIISSSGWKILNSFKEVQTSTAFFVKKKKKREWNKQFPFERSTDLKWSVFWGVV